MQVRFSDGRFPKVTPLNGGKGLAFIDYISWQQPRHERSQYRRIIGTQHQCRRWIGAWNLGLQIRNCLLDARIHLAGSGRSNSYYPDMISEYPSGRRFRGHRVRRVDPCLVCHVADDLVSDNAIRMTDLIVRSAGAW